MTDREKLMRSIQICDFALFEAALFLDTHTKDKEALAYYNKHNKQATELREQYTKLYGPITISASDSKEVWEWAQGPWPWEYSSDSNGV